MVYDRTHTRDLGDLERMRLFKVIPFAAFTFVVGGLASMGLPGFSGFIAELQVLIGAWRAFPTYAVIAGIGILVGVAYTIRTISRSFFSGEPAPVPLRAVGETASHSSPGGHLPPISVPERLGALLLMLLTLVVGIYPWILLRFITSALSSPLFNNLLKGANP